MDNKLNIHNKKSKPQYSMSYENYMRKYNCYFTMEDIEFKKNYTFALSKGLPIEQIIDTIINEFCSITSVDENGFYNLSNIENNKIPCYITFRDKSKKIEMHHSFLVQLQGNETYGQIIDKIIVHSVKNIVQLFCVVKNNVNINEYIDKSTYSANQTETGLSIHNNEQNYVCSEDTNSKELSLYTKLNNQSTREITYYYRLYSSTNNDYYNNQFYNTFYK